MFDLFRKKTTEKERIVKVTQEQTAVGLVLPCKGQLIALADVADPVFSQKMVGDGFAILPSLPETDEGQEMLVIFEAPVSGEIVQIFPTNHAFGIKTSDGLEVLVHVGIDTVTLKGSGFERLSEVGAIVQVGTPILKVDLKAIVEAGKSLCTPVIVTNMELVSNIVYDTLPGDTICEGGTKGIQVILK